jgi:hypothetical protein
MGSVFSSYTLRKKEWAHVQDEKSISASKIEVSWAMGDSVPYYRFLLGTYVVPTVFLNF